MAVKLISFEGGTGPREVLSPEQQAQLKAQLREEVALLARASLSSAHVCRLYGICAAKEYLGREYLAIVMRKYPCSLLNLIERQPAGARRSACILWCILWCTQHAGLTCCPPVQVAHMHANDACHACKHFMFHPIAQVRKPSAAGCRFPAPHLAS